MARRNSQLSKIRKAKHDLEQHARDQGAQRARTKARNAGHPSDVAEEAAGRAAETATPKAKAQRNFTDADSRIMKTADGSFHYCYNAQAVVDEANQVIVATDFADSGADNPAFADMLAQTHTNTGITPAQTLADAGYFSEANIDAAHQAGTDPFIATGRLAHGDRTPDAPRGPIPKDATPKARMARKLRTKKGKTTYSRRKVIVEPVFGQMKTTQGAGKLLLRGHDNARAEWRLLAACYNL